MVNIFVANLNEATTWFIEQIFCQKEPVIEVRQIAVDAKFPSIPECLDRFRFCRNVGIVVVFDFALVNERLEIWFLFDAVVRIDVAPLISPGHTFFFE